MKIVEPSVEYWEQVNPIEHVCKCAQISYQSEPKKGEAAQKFYNSLISSNHVSTLRHESCYYIIPVDNNISIPRKEEGYKIHISYWLGEHNDCPYMDYYINDNIYIATNGNFVLDHQNEFEIISEFKVSPQEFKEKCPELMRYTFCLTTQISTTRELNRVSPNNISEMSTRYIKFGGKVEPSIVRPHWITDEHIKLWEKSLINSTFTWCAEDLYVWQYLFHCKQSFEMYDILNNDFKLKQQDARGLLPLDTMSKVIYTYSIKEWRAIIDLRYYGTTGAPHPNAKIIIGMVKNKLEELGYEFR